MMKVALIGLGPVGLATAWSLLKRGHIVHGYDTNLSLVKQCRQGEFPRAEALGDELRAAASSQLFMHDNISSLLSCEIIVICVGTPAENHGFNLDGLRSALFECRVPKGGKGKRHYIIRSTLTPGSTQKEILPLLQAGAEFDLSYYPEFLREKYLREDLMAPPMQAAAHSSPAAQERFSILFPGSFQVLQSYASAEALKIASNAFHALKVVFANEMADLCEKAGGSAEEMMRAFREDKKLNISALYLNPGAPFGGPCLDKDLRALEHALGFHGIPGDLLRSIRKSNNRREAEGYGPSADQDGLFAREKELARKEDSSPAG